MLIILLAKTILLNKDFYRNEKWIFFNFAYANINIIYFMKHYQYNNYCYTLFALHNFINILTKFSHLS